MKPRYIVACSDQPMHLAGIDGGSEVGPGWFLLICDDDGRQAFVGGPYLTAEGALRAIDSDRAATPPLQPAVSSPCDQTHSAPPAQPPAHTPGSGGEGLRLLNAVPSASAIPPAPADRHQFGDRFEDYIEDGHGNSWPKCKPDCRMQVVRPGKVQCDCNADKSGAAP